MIYKRKNMDIIIWNIFRILTFYKILFLKLIWVKIWLFSKSIIWHIPKIRYAKMINIWNNFQIWKYCRMTWNIEIWNNVFINEFSSINAWPSIDSKITIWNYVMFWPWVLLQSSDHAFRKWEIYMQADWWKAKQIIIWNNVWVWARTIVLKWVTIWDNSVIWAWSVVTKDIPSWVVAVWNPAKVIKEII
jgi:acetyltransferase-like isoleucine patch superfamily enzyme